ncbi:MAG: hypothetical protein HYY18_09485 [Planctomycetes bacterium]|nr:hypothetical protein [Planctomycetota bacterium]
MKSTPTAAALLLLLASLAPAEDALAARERELKRYLVAEHEKLARSCLEKGLREEAVGEFRAILAADPGNAAAERMLADRGRLWVTDWTKDEHAAYLEYRDLRKLLNYEASERFLALGSEKKTSGNPTGAKAAWLRALDYDADYAEARALLGQAKADGAGWVPKAEAEKRARGLLQYGGKWLPAAEVKARRAKWADAWEVKGAHFSVKSNLSEPAAREALEWAEEMHAAFVRETSGVLEAPDDKSLMPIYLFATRADYDAHNRTAHGGTIPGTAVGFYSNEDKAAHFWKREEEGVTPLEHVVRHECLHQVMDRWIPFEDDPTARPHFWVYEGFARYFESIVNLDGKVLTGFARHPPFQVARVLAAKGKGLKLGELFALTQGDMGDHYDQASGVVHFFMHAGSGEFRERFLNYVRTVHRGEAVSDTFEQVFGQPPGDFDAPYRAYIKALK